MKLIPCNSCGSTRFKFLYSKSSHLNEIFEIVKCKSCGLVQVNPQPSFEEVSKYYTNDYFTKRTDRGYDNYYSSEIRNEIERVFQLNLKDLNFFEWENSLIEKKTLDIGSAAGYFVAYMKFRNWNSIGIEISDEPVRFAKEILKQEVYKNDFLDWDKEFKNKFQLITLWASIEHLHLPKETIQKIYSHLEPNGRIILSTCRYGIISRLRGIKWRFLNVPEHLYYYSKKNLIDLFEGVGFKVIKQISYGSGFTAKKNSSKFYQICKKIFDKLVKLTNQGDMIVLVAEKI